MLSTKELQIVFKLKRRLLYLFMALLFSLYWIRMKYSDLEYFESELKMNQYEIIELEEKNTKLKTKIDSLLKLNKQETVKKESIIIKKQEEKKDTAVSKIFESTLININGEQIDTLKQ